jgi:phage terminase large subunit
VAYTVKKSGIRLPPGCGEDLDKAYLYNPYLHDPDPAKGFFAALRLRVCLKCYGMGPHRWDGVFECPKCHTVHHSHATAPRAFDRFSLLAGRGGGKTLAGAHAVREELMIPDSTWWAMGPTYKILWDSTFPTLVRLLNPDWIARWDAEHDEIILKNKSKVAFRSLEDPERARGPHGIKGGWFDEAAQSPERAYDVFAPTLLKAGGIVIATTTVLGYDWTYDAIEKRALVYKEAGYWATKWWTEENPVFAMNPQAMKQIERDKRRMPPDFFAQEYKAERRNAQGLVYDYSVIEKQCLLDFDQVKAFIPEWPAIDPSRLVIIGLDSGADHPFGAVMIVATEKGLVVVKEYLKRERALSLHLPAIIQAFGLSSAFTNIKWAANKNEKNLRLEFALKDIGVIPAENKHEVGIQRVQAWLHSQKLFFAYTCPLTIEQMRAYRYADNLKPSGEKKVREEVFKFKDELPDGVRYAMMAWPELPVPVDAPMDEREQRRWAGLDERSKAEILRMREYNKRADGGETDLDEKDELYPLGSFVGMQGEDDNLWS